MEIIVLWHIIELSYEIVHLQIGGLYRCESVKDSL